MIDLSNERISELLFEQIKNLTVFGCIRGEC